MKYKVIINEGWRVGSFATEDEVWDFIGKQPFGSRYVVSPLKPGVDVSQFIPF